MAKALRSPFSLIRQAISHAQFDDKETRERVVGLLDDIQSELEFNQFEFTHPDTIQSVGALQEHLVELLQSQDEVEEATEIALTESPTRKSVSGGDLEDDDEDQ